MRIANPYVLESVTSAIGETLTGLVVTPVVVAPGAMAIETAAVPIAASWVELSDDVHLVASIGPAMPVRSAVESTATAVAGLGR
jgi:hypothetical protein